MTSLQTSPEQRYAAFRHKAFLSYWTARFLTTFATMIVSVAVGWQMYDLTRDPFDLGIVGIVQFLPSLLLVLVTGAVADRFGRRLIMALAVVVEAICALALLALTLRGISGPLPIFCVLAMFGVARAFFGPASASLFANLVPPEDFANAIAWNSSAWQTATIVGPVAGGLLYGVSPEVAYGTAAVLMLASGLLIFTIPKPAQRTETEKPTLQNLFGGFSYIWSEKIVLGAISLDLFAVLLSGASALLPVYARDILQLGPWGLGLLRSAPSIGAICVAVWLAGHPMRSHAGMIMLAAAASFGAFTVLFGLSTITWLSIVALILLGATDMFSVYIRETLIQLWTPDEVRGRVNAVNQVFVGASNEVGEFRAGTMAALIGTVPAVVIGGVGAIAVAGLWMVLFPQLRKVRHLNGRN
ncbi:MULTISPECIES: MFS transporter [Mesorhizobium]|uniref:MFS transporter n=2 Tax=Mesorhizobium TaxID=68287 RepID=A0A1A5I7C7_RHILI|nr:MULTISPECIES: MFS transporter [Mesorhizobium]MBE1710379.1 MFS transporter [Mesorhizobium japonicum]MBE1712277.1 MFS transporter [Mesorhizobium japonicum]MUT22656.1 MFS transporter [Mesorhizobium japonicum]MUT31019.1 MFS transporter [Mesorhizobium japonicum]OBP73068.1 MFS transporter [Mesorhizobium loti]